MKPEDVRSGFPPESRERRKYRRRSFRGRRKFNTPSRLLKKEQRVGLIDRRGTAERRQP